MRREDTKNFVDLRSGRYQDREWLLGWLLGQQIEPHIPVWDKSQRRDGSFSRADFAYDKARDIYGCFWRPRGLR